MIKSETKEKEFAPVHFGLADQAADYNQQAICALDHDDDPFLAEIYYLEAIKCDPDSPILHYNLGILYEGFLFDPKAARVRFERAIQLDPGYKDAYMALCELCLEMGTDLEIAFSCAHKIKELDPRDSRNLNNLGCLFVNYKKDYQMAACCFKEAVENSPQSSSFFANLADAYRLLEYFDEAAAAYQQALVLDPENPGYCYQYAQLLRYYFHEYEEAECYYKKAIQIQPDNLAPYRALSSLYTFEHRHHRRAVQILETAEKHFPQDSTLLLDIAGIYDYQLHDFQKAREYYEKVVNLTPANKAAWSALAVVYSEMLKDYEKGMDAYLQLLQLEPDNLTANLNIGHLNFYHLDAAELAAGFYEKALSLMDSRGEIDLYGGEIYLSLGILYEQHYKEVNKAIDYYERAIESGNEELAKRRLMRLYTEELRIH